MITRPSSPGYLGKVHVEHGRLPESFGRHVIVEQVVGIVRRQDNPQNVQKK